MELPLPTQVDRCAKPHKVAGTCSPLVKLTTEFEDLKKSYYNSINELKSDMKTVKSVLTGILMALLAIFGSLIVGLVVLVLEK